MKQTKDLMGMPITVEITDNFTAEKAKEAISVVFSYFKYVDDKFSTYKDTSEISRINRGEINQEDYSRDVKTIFDLSEKTKKETDGYFDIIKPDGSCDPSGLVKGWSIYNAAKLLHQMNIGEFYIDAGGDIQAEEKYWKVGIKNPFNEEEIIKIVYIKDMGVATSGTYIRGQHIYNPRESGKPITEIVSLTVIGPNVYEADRFATAAFAMGKKGIVFIENLKNLEGYIVDADGVATMTSGFEAYTVKPAE